MLRRAQKRGEATLIGHQLFTDACRGQSDAENRPKASSQRADTHLQVGYWVVAQNRLVERTIELRLAFQLCSFPWERAQVFSPTFESKKLQSRLAALLDLRQKRRFSLIRGGLRIRMRTNGLARRSS
jgi:hypothetical protein